MGSRRAMRPLEARFDQLPDMTPVAPYPGMTSRIQTLCRSVTSARSSLEPWDIISATGRRIQIPRSKDGVPLCSAAVACALADLRDTVNNTCTAFAWDEDGLWHLNASTDGYARWHPIASVQHEFGITAAEHRGDIEEYVRHAVIAEPQARIVHGVKFADRGFCRDEDVVNNHTSRCIPTIRCGIARGLSTWAASRTIPTASGDSGNTRLPSCTRRPWSSSPAWSRHLCANRICTESLSFPAKAAKEKVRS